MFIHEAHLDNQATQATHAATRGLIQFCVSKIHALQAALLTATDQAEVLETIAQMQAVQLSMSILTIALVSDDASIINQAKTLLRSIN
jgi:uncharacterized protein YigA (DUF484 family)